MKILVLNGSPHKDGPVAAICKAVADSAAQNKHQIEWINVYDLCIAPCIGCMKCRPNAQCSEHKDDGNIVGQKIKEADGLIVGTPAHWANMSAQLKMLFDRNVPVFIGQTADGKTFPRQKGKPAVIVVTCSQSWPMVFITKQRRGAYRVVRDVLHHGGYKLLGGIAVSGLTDMTEPPQKVLEKAKRLGSKF